ncbi:MAG: hypothetical protein LIP01_14450 [Tannerellaceae bacterium]|nr:hypothetical protein [Tannerellaceae bacterium]
MFTIRETNTPLNGLHRIMDRVKTEYILAEFEEGLYHGAYKRYVDKLLIEKGTYQKGYKQGTFLEYFRGSHTVKESKEYKDGLLDGVCIRYFTDGQIERERIYKEGRQEGEEVKYDFHTREVRARLNYHNGKKEGKQWQYIYSNVGNFIQENTYRDGVLEGESLEIWWTGYVRKKGHYKKDN